MLARRLLCGGGGGALRRVEQLGGGLELARHAVARAGGGAQPRLHLLERRGVARVRLVLSSLDLADASLAIYDAANLTDAAAPTAVALQPAAIGAPYLPTTGGP